MKKLKQKTFTRYLLALVSLLLLGTNALKAETKAVQWKASEAAINVDSVITSLNLGADGQNALQVAFGNTEDWYKTDGTAVKLTIGGVSYDFGKPYISTKNANGKDDNTNLTSDGSTNFNYIGFVPQYDGVLTVVFQNAGSNKKVKVRENGETMEGEFTLIKNNGNDTEGTSWTNVTPLDASAAFNGGLQFAVKKGSEYTISLGGSKARWGGILFTYDDTPAGPAVPYDVTFDFTTYDGPKSSGTGNTYVGDGEIEADTVFVENGVNMTITLNDGTGSSSNANTWWTDKTFRMYGGFLMLEAEEGLAITKVVINNQKWTNTTTANGVTLTSGNWQGNSTNVVFDIGGNTQMKSIVVTLDAKNDQTTTYEFELPKQPESVANTEETAYTVAQAFEVIDKITSGEAKSGETVFVKGTVSKVDSYNPDYNSITYWISEDGTTEGQQLQVYSGKGIGGADFASVDDVKVGANVIVKGELKKYNTTYEFDKNNELVKYEYTEPEPEVTEPSVELIHTASSYAEATANDFKSTVDAEFETVNNSNMNGTWAGCAYADFAVSIPEDLVVTKATLVFTGRGESRNTRNTDVMYANAGGALDYEALAGGTAKVDLAATKITSVTFPKGEGATQEFTIDATEALKTILAAEQGNIIFKFTGNPGGGALLGKGSAKAPQLTIETVNISETTSYTVNFLDAESNVLKEAVVHTAQLKGAEVTASAAEMASFKNEDGSKMYIYESGNETITLKENAEENVINLVFREAAKYTYTLKATSDDAAVDNITIATGEDFEGTTVTVPYGKYLNVEGTLYQAAQGTAGYYLTTVTLDANNKQATIMYAPTEITNVVYFSEAEDIEGMTTETGGNANVRCSNGAGGYAAEPVTATTLQPGKYTVTANIWGNSGTTIMIEVGTDTLKLETKGYLFEDTSAEIVLMKATDVVIEGAVANKPLDYLYIVKTGDVEIFGDEAIEGEWNFTINDHYAGVSSLGEVTDKYTATLEGNTVTFMNEWEDAPIVAEFTAKNTLTFKKVAVSEGTYPKMQNPFTAAPTETVEDIDPEAFTFAEFTATFDPEAGTLTFPEGVVGLAYGTATGADGALEYQMAFDLVSAKKAGAEEATVRRWDFTKWSEATVTNLIADAAQSVTEGWSDVEKKEDTEPTETSKDNCFWSVNTPDEIGGLSANKVLIDELKGLKFGANVNNRGLAIAVNYPVALSTYEGPSYLWLGGANKKFFTIPAVKAGSTIKMGVESHKTTDARGVDLLANGTSIGQFTPTTYDEHTWTVTADEAVNIVVDNTNGCHIYFIEVEQDQEALLDIVKADLETVLGVVGEIDTDIYTTESVAALAEALANAQAVKDGNDAATIAEATYALLNAKAALVDIATGINTVVKSQFENGVVYNLQGQKVMKAQKGLYIINGKKVVVK